jgi:uncharacterized Zn finger protein
VSWGGFAPYVSAAEKRRRLENEIKRLQKQGRILVPVVIEGRAIASTFWGRSWCENLEAYSDFATRLPRGRSYARNGSVVDLQIARGSVKALVSGSDLYTVTIDVTPVAKARWRAIQKDCGTAIASLVDLLRGHLSKPVMARLCRQAEGLFPTPDEIELACSCPDSAYMCKHVAAVLYGIGARLDPQPELLFTLRDCDPQDLIARAGRDLPTGAVKSGRILASEDLGALFGLPLAKPRARRR